MKKPSLFKQQINAYKNKIQQKQTSFPSTFQIQVEKNPLEAKTIEEKMHKNEVIEQKTTQNLMDSIKKTKVLPEEELNKISTENWNKISSMTQKQRQEALQFINSQLPQSFISKIAKHKLQQEKKESLLNKKVIISSQDNLPKQQKKKQIIQESQHIKQPNQSQFNNTKKIIQKEQKQRQEDEEKQNWSQNLKLNIQNFKLAYTSSSNDNLINISSLLLMIGSDNNQSQIVGSKLTLEFINQLCEQTTSKTRELIMINNMPLHVGVILQYISSHIICFVLKQARKTTFRSIFIELTSKSIQSALKSLPFVSKKCKTQLSTCFKAINEKTKSFDLKEENIRQINSSLQSVISQLTSDKDRFDDYNWGQAIKNIQFIIQTILLEEFQVDYTNKYSQSITLKIQKCSDLSEIIQILHFLYILFNELILKKNKEQYISIIKIRQHWIKAIDILVLKISTKLNNLQIDIVFQACFLARFIGDLTWNDLMNRIQQLVLIKPMMQYCLLFNTLLDLKGSNIQQENLQGLNSMFQWLSKVNFNPNYLMNTLVQLFLQNDQYYSRLNERILQNLIINLCSHKQINLNIVLNQQKVRTLIKNYNYDSFGNEIFTKLLLFAVIRLQQTLQGLILRQTILPYVQIFYRIGTQLIEYKHIISKRRSHGQLKQQIVEKMKNISIQLDRANLLYYYLEI